MSWGENTCDICIAHTYMVTILQLYIRPGNFCIRYAAVVHKSPFRHLTQQLCIYQAHVNSCSAEGLNSLSAAKVIIVTMAVNYYSNIFWPKT